MQSDPRFPAHSVIRALPQSRSQDTAFQRAWLKFSPRQAELSRIFCLKATIRASLPGSLHSLAP